MDTPEVGQRRYRIPLETPRLTLCPLAAGDIEWLARLFAEPEANRFLWAGEPLRAAQARQHAEAFVAFDAILTRFGHWAIEDRQSGAVHGWVEPGKLEFWQGPSDEIGLNCVLFPEFRRRGIATEAAVRLLRHALETIGLDCVMAVINAEKTASRRVLEKLGMEFVSQDSYAGRKLEFFRIARTIQAQKLNEVSN